MHEIRDGYQFANVKDPEGHSVSISGRLYQAS